MTNYEEYVSEQINKSISYSEYVAQQIDRNISYTEYLSGMYDTKNVKRKKKIKNLFK
jgi:hypothetical protein